jgi:hypothetical protein
LDDARTLSGKTFSRNLPNAGRGASDDDDFTFHLHAKRNLAAQLISEYIIRVPANLIDVLAFFKISFRDGEHIAFAGHPDINRRQ